MKLTRKFIFLTFLLSISFTFSQKQLDIEKKKIFDSLDLRKISSALEVHNNGKEMLKYAQSDYEFSRAYHTMGDGKYKYGDYKSAILLLEKADLYAKSTNVTDIRVAINSLLVYTYRFAGLPTESDEKLKVIEKITNKNQVTDQALVLQVKATALEIDKKFCEAIPIRKQELELYQNKVKFGNEQHKNEILTFANIHSAYLELKCGEYDEALKKLHIVENYYENFGDKKPTYYIENYYLVKALISNFEKDNISAKKWFSKSYESAEKTQNKMVMKKILYEMRDSNIFTSLAEKNEISEALLNIQNFQTEVSKEVATKEVNKMNLELRNEKSKQIIYSIIIAILILGIVLISLYYIRRNQKIQTNYQQIIDAIEQKKAQKVIPLNDGPITGANPNDQTIPQESKIVKDLTKQEEKLFFISKNSSATQLAALLKITPRNLSHILKKYRNDDFYNYLNTLRIEYICNVLKEHPEYLNYKIAVLAEMCGYSSHSHFTIMFKNKTGISPSQYINLLRKEKK